MKSTTTSRSDSGSRRGRGQATRRHPSSSCVSVVVGCTIGRSGRAGAQAEADVDVFSPFEPLLGGRFATTTVRTALALAGCRAFGTPAGTPLAQHLTPRGRRAALARRLPTPPVRAAQPVSRTRRGRPRRPPARSPRPISWRRLVIPSGRNCLQQRLACIGLRPDSAAPTGPIDPMDQRGESTRRPCPFWWRKVSRSYLNKPRRTASLGATACYLDSIESP